MRGCQKRVTGNSIYVKRFDMVWTSGEMLCGINTPSVKRQAAALKF